MKGKHVQIVQGRCGIAHQRHEEQRYLQHVFGNEVQPDKHIVVPGDGIQREDEAKEPYEHPNTKDLECYMSNEYRQGQR